MLYTRRLTLALGALLMMVLGAFPTANSALAQNRQCFTETTFCIEGRFLEYWQQSGGLAVFGFPIGPAQNEVNRDTGKTYLTQWFERNRFELHPENARPYDVLLGRLGEDTLIKMGRDWRSEYREPTAPLPGDCEMPSTGDKIFLLCPPFRNYYRSHGLEFDGRPGFEHNESLALFGLPLTQARVETNSSGDTVMTQWFERARMEFHPNNPEPYKVLLGLLGNEIKGRAQPAPTFDTVVTFLKPDGTVYETRGGQPQPVDRVYGRGKVIDAVRDGNTMTVLNEGGLMAVRIGAEDQTIAEFTQGNALFGSLVAPHNSSKIFYSFARRGSSPVGYDGIAGVIENGSARKLRETPNTMEVLGIGPNDNTMLVIDRGGDPSFVEVKVISMADGRVLATLPYSGDGPAALAPDRNTIATPYMRDGHADMVVLYSLLNQTGAPRNAPIGRTGWNITQITWAHDSGAVYALAYPSTDQPTGELWRIDTARLKSTLVASALPLDARLIGIGDDAKTLLAQFTGGALLVDVRNGQQRTYAVPEDAIIAGW